MKDCREFLSALDMQYDNCHSRDLHKRYLGAQNISHLGNLIMVSPDKRDMYEKYIAETVCKSFSKNAYSCRFNYPLFGRGGVRYIADVFCKRKKDQAAIEIKNIASVKEADIQQLVLHSKFLSRIRWYLCIPSSTELTSNAKSILEKNGIGLILFEDGRITMESMAVSSAEFTTRLKNSWQTLSREHMERVKRVYEGERFPEEKGKIDGFLMPRISRRGSEISPSEYYALYSDALLKYRQKLSQMEIILGRSIPTTLRISLKLLDQIRQLQNMNYATELVKFEQRYRKADSFDKEYQIVLDTLKNLWTRYEKERGAAAFRSFKDFEPMLMEIPGYRDHMIHPFQVFLMGSIIIDKFYDHFLGAYKLKLKNANKSDLDFAWLMASTFHDFCYPIQMYEFVNERLFKKFLQTEDTSMLPRLQTEKILLQKGQLKLLDQLISLCSHCMNDSENSGWIFDTKCKIDDNFRYMMVQEITARKNHAPLSALTLLNMILSEEVSTKRGGYMEETFSTAICPAALAIALHDEKVLKNLPKETNIVFESLPIALLLIYCDTAQDFGRSSQKDYCSLKDLDMGKDYIETSLVFFEKSAYKRKMKEVESIMNRLKSKTVAFKLHLIFEDEEFSKATGQP